MTVNDFEAMVARAGYELSGPYGKQGKLERRIYIRRAGGPKLNVQVNDGVVSDFDAAVIEALLDEERYFQSGKGDEDDPQGGSG